MLFRDIKRYKLQMFAVVLIVFIGITLFSACVMSYKNLQIFKDEFYLDNNFLDAYVDGLNLDSKDLKDIEKIEKYAKDGWDDFWKQLIVYGYQRRMRPMVDSQ